MLSQWAIEWLDNGSSLLGTSLFPDAGQRSNVPHPEPPQQIEQLNEVKHRKLLAVLPRLGYAADAEGTWRWGSARKVNDHSQANNGSGEQTSVPLHSIRTDELHKTGRGTVCSSSQSLQRGFQSSWAGEEFCLKGLKIKSSIRWETKSMWRLYF